MPTEKNKDCLCSHRFIAIIQSLVRSALGLQLKRMVTHILESINSQYFRGGVIAKENGYPFTRVYQ